MDCHGHEPTIRRDRASGPASGANLHTAPAGSRAPEHRLRFIAAQDEQLPGRAEACHPRRGQRDLARCNALGHIPDGELVGCGTAGEQLFAVGGEAQCPGSSTRLPFEARGITVSDSPATSKRVARGENARLQIQPWNFSFCCSFADPSSQRQTTPSQSPEATSLPSEETASAMTRRLCSRNVRTSRPVATCQICTRLSFTATRCLPSALKTMAPSPLLPQFSWRSRRPEGSCQSLIWPSDPLEASSGSLGEKARQRIIAPCVNRALPIRARAPRGSGSPYWSARSCWAAAGC